MGGSIVRAALDVVFPRRCVGCERGRWPFCPDCAATVIPLGPPWCERCGSPAVLSVERCADCPSEPIAGSRSPFLYRGPVRRAIHRLKYAGWRSAGDALSAAMAVADLPAIEIITWVPLSRRRLGERGYDQARVLAEGLARRTGRTCVPMLRRVVHTSPQAKRDAHQRKTAMRGVFTLSSRSRRTAMPSRVLLVDDVLTSGATAEACARVLRGAGVREVHVATAARALQLPSDLLALRQAPALAYPHVGPRPGLWLPGDHPR
jgi:ComF family protein